MTKVVQNHISVIFSLDTSIEKIYKSKVMAVSNFGNPHVDIVTHIIKSTDALATLGLCSS